MHMKQTSGDSPIRVDFLPDGVTSLPGRIGLTVAPGKKDHKWDRDLQVDLDRLHDEHGISVIVSLIEDSELDLLGMRGYEEAVSRVGMALYRLPIKDRVRPDLDAGYATHRHVHPRPRPGR